MGEVVSYVKESLDTTVVEIAIVGTDLVITHLDGSETTLDLSAVSSVTQADIDAAVAALVDSAPGVLNTLNELAAALGDDANFAANIISSLASETANRTAAIAGAMGVVVHGAVAATARPAGYGAIHWIGSVAPTNAIDNDVWTDTSA